MDRTILNRTAQFFAQSVEWLVLVFLLAAATPPILLHPHSLTVVPTLNLIDDSWVLDTSFKAAQGVWFGRDVAFTYGPLYQWLSSAPSRWIGLSTGSIYATAYTLILLVIILATFATVRLLLPEAAGWRRALLLLLAVVYWSPPNVRISLCLLFFVVFLRLTSEAVLPSKPVALRALAAAAICLVAFLLSADTGLYTVAALLLCIAATAMAKGRLLQLAKFLVIAGLGFAPLVLATNWVMASPLDFKFWRTTMVIASAYRWFEPLAMDKAHKLLVFASLAVGVAVFGAAWWWRRPSGRWTLRPAFLLAGFAWALVTMQSSLVRSDHGHVLMGTYCMIFLCGAIALDEPDAPSRWGLVLPLAALVATLILAQPVPVFLPGNLADNVRQIVHPVRFCPEGRQEFDHACFWPPDADLLSRVTNYIGLHAGPGDPIVVFPYENTFGLTSRHRVSGGVLQSYLVNGDYLTDLELAGLREANPLSGLYFPDGLISVGVDFVPSFTRSPEVWFYLLRHYRSANDALPGAVGLERDDSRATHVTLSERTIAPRTAPTWIHRRSTSVELLPGTTAQSDFDFLKLRLRVDYPAWWRLRKPSKLTLQMSFADRSEKTIQFLVPPDHTTDVWVYPWDDKQMGQYFSEDRSQWRLENRPQLTGAKLMITPFDWLSVVPISLTVESVAAVQLEMH